MEVRRPTAHSVVDRLGAYSWRLVGIGVVGWVLLQILGALRIVVLPFVVAVFLTAILGPPANWLQRRGWPPLAAAWAVFLSFIGAVTVAVVLIVPPLSAEFGNVSAALTEAVDGVEAWLVEDSPFNLDRERLEELEGQATSRIRDAIAQPGGFLLDTAVLALEIVAGLLLALVMTFFFLKDGDHFQHWGLRRVPDRHHEAVRRGAARGWQAITGHLRGCAALGAVEAAVIGAAVAITGGSLVLPVMVLTFVAAFVPFVGAVAAGVVAVAVALATAGPGPAIVVAVVAVVVQQLDNDLLAPFVFGKALDLHPLIILIVVTGGGTLAGIAGAFVAVPLTAVIINVTDEIVNPERPDPVGGTQPDSRS